MNEIKKVPFTKESIDKLNNLRFGVNWPVVYLINNEKEMYIGESSNVFDRMKKHIKDEDKKDLQDLNIVYDSRFNKSAILDIESLLIQYVSADKKFKLKNRNNGQSQAHDYYQRQMYLDSFEQIWRKLQRKALVDKNLDTIRNLDMFKFSPYKTLTTDQYNTSQNILLEVLKNLKSSGFSSVINGSAGTGKTVLAVYLMKLLSDCIHNTYNMEDLEDEDEIYTNLAYLKNLPKFDFALVIPMTSLRKTLKAVFRETDGLSASMVIGPNEVVKKDYDLLIIDEAHRLKRRRNLTNYASFDITNKALGLDESGTELDWILKCSKFQILFYDEAQTIKPTDIRPLDFKKLIEKENTHSFNLTSQLRVLGGNDYIKYVTELLSNTPPNKVSTFENYDVQIFDHLDDMIKEIKSKNNSYGLCRVVAGYAWNWKNKGKKHTDIKKQGIYDIQIEGKQYIWNTTNENWVNSEHSIDEIGCIHTIQGYDLNYTGVVFGNEIIYNKSTKQIEILESNYYDKNGKNGITSKADLAEYIINIYKVLLTRGIRGTFIYACDENLRDYLKKYL